VGPLGEVYYVDRGSQRIRVIVTSPFVRNANEVAVASPNGSEVWTFTKNGRHLRTTDATLGIVKYTFEYSTEGLLTAVVDVDGKKLTMTRDGAGKVSALIGPYGHTTTVTLDGNNQVASLKNPLNEMTELAMSPLGLLSEMKDARGGRHVYEYDASGRLTKDTNADGEFQVLGKADISPSGFEVSVTTAEGRIEKYAKATSGTGESQTRTYTDGTTSAFTWPNDGSHLSTSANGTVTTVKQMGDARFGVQSPLSALTEVKLPSGLTLKMERSNAVEYVNGLASKGIAKLVEAFSVNGDTATSTYTQSDRTFRTVSPEGRVFSATVNAQGRPATVKLPGITDTVMEYTPLGQLAAVAQGKRKLSFQYNGQGLPETVTDALGRVQKLEYNAATRVTALTLPGQRNMKVDTDATANVTGLTPPGKQTHSMGYTPNSKLASYMPPLASPGGQVNSTAYRYNKDGQLVEEVLPGNTSVTMAYEKDKGRLFSMTTSRTQVQYSYNTKGQLSSLTDVKGASLAMQYDGDLLTGVTFSGGQKGTVAYAYDSKFQVKEVKVNAQSIAYGYDKDGLVTSAGQLQVDRDEVTGFMKATTLGSVSSTMAYSPFGEMEKHEVSANGQSLYSESLAFDDLGRVVTKAETLQGVLTTSTYGYDEAGRLASVNTTGATNSTSSYQYDANGNRTQTTENGQATTATYDGEDRLQQSGNASYTFTPLGQLFEKVEGASTTRYTYDTVGALTQVTLPSGVVIDYVIDAAGRRVGKKLNGALQKGWLYESALRIIAETDGNGAVTARFVYATQSHSPDFMVSQGRTYRLVKDHLGSVRLVVDSVSGEVKQRIDYDAWGKVTADSNPGFQPFGFAGGLYDSDTNLTRFGARDYASGTGRWTAKDPIRFQGGDSNLYAYVRNSPQNGVDPNGLELRIAPSSRIAAWLTGRGAELYALEAAIERLNRPVCKCARDNLTGHKNWPWEGRNVELVVGDPVFPMAGASGFTDPVNGRIFLQWTTSSHAYAGTIAHEAGHLWWPYSGGADGEYNAKYGTTHTLSPQNYGASRACGASNKVQEGLGKELGCQCD
jgi:RHS repeat-associated protein